MSATKTFGLGDVLSITTGILVAPDRMDAVYRILNYMTGDNLYTHQLPRACRAVAPVILQQHPKLAEIHLEKMDKDDVDATVSRLAETYGNEFSLTPMADYQHQDPISELLSLRAARPVEE